MSSQQGESEPSAGSSFFVREHDWSADSSAACFKQWLASSRLAGEGEERLASVGLENTPEWDTAGGELRIEILVLWK